MVLNSPLGMHSTGTSVIVAAVMLPVKFVMKKPRSASDGIVSKYGQASGMDNSQACCCKRAYASTSLSWLSLPIV